MNKLKRNLPTPFDRLMSLMTTPWFAISYFLLVALCFLYIDQPLALFFQSLDVESNFPILVWITNIGLGGIYIVSLFILVIVFRYIYQRPVWEKRVWFLWLCVVIPSLICLILKYTLGRARPMLLFNDGLYGFYGFKTKAAYWSFPSGHTTTITGLAFGLCIIFPKYAYAFLITALCIATSRVLLTHHYLSDVLMAAYLSFLEVAIIYWWYQRKLGVSQLSVRQQNYSA
ncbi:phosphatase PAP2 family protein [Legionella yabuuchiae]|uniref:phosphatase PAP2 family protein n=1 Tax=Legionella yabuuchiae TaxID=376727 RepID=UPI0013EF9D24|nr:phosphatase PAP2 family protein [Legionella yabuuchiae]